MTAYDRWLEAPYQQAAAEGDAYVNWCEANDLDPDDDNWDDFRDAMDDAAEDRAIEEGERRMEARRDALEDRDW